MHNLSLVQALSLWTDFEKALAGTNGYGGHIAEIYAYRLMSFSPTYASIIAGANAKSELNKEEIFLTQREASQSLLSLLKHFQEIHPDCEIWVNDTLLSVCEPDPMFGHRCHVTIK